MKMSQYIVLVALTHVLFLFEGAQCASFMGCYKQDVVTFLTKNGGNTYGPADWVKTDTCNKYCKNDGFDYAGMKDKTCYCSLERPSYKYTAKPSLCSTWKGVILYSLDDDDRANYVDGNHVACYRKDETFYLEGYHDTIDNSTNMSPEICVGNCFRQGYEYAALFEGSKCICGTRVEGHKIDRNVFCDVPCTGNGRLPCGGKYAFDFYQTHSSGGDIEPINPTNNPTQDPITTHIPTTPSTNHTTTQTPTRPSTNPTTTQTPTSPATKHTTTQTPTMPSTNPTTTQIPTVPSTIPTTTQTPTRPSTNPTTTQTPTVPSTIPTTTQTPTRPSTNPTTTQTPTSPATKHTTTQTPTMPSTNPTTTQIPTVPSTISNTTQTPTRPSTSPTTTPSPNCTTPQTPTDPTPIPDHNSGKHVRLIGCYKENSVEAPLMSGEKIKFSALTPDKCISHCLSKHYNYAALQQGFECFCSNERPSYKFSGDLVDCNVKCKGNSNEICGGVSSLSVYDLNDKYVNYVLNMNVGCYADTGAGSCRALEGDVRTESDLMTPEFCLGFCHRNGFMYGGVQNANQCFCGDEIRGSAVNEGDCDLDCPGSNHTKCGGTYRSSIYRTSIPDERDDGRFIGCFSATDKLILSGAKRVLNKTNSPKKCISMCLNLGYKFAGLQDGDQCHCGNIMPPRVYRTPENECQALCPGGQTRKCGGTNRLSVYKTDQVDTFHCSDCMQGSLMRNW